MKTKSIKTSWLHISDLHVFNEADTRFILEDYEKLANVINPNFIIITGDFRHLKYKTNFNATKKYLESIIKTFNVDKSDVFLIPGNHDTNTYENRRSYIDEICQNSDKDYNLYSKFLEGKTSLYDAFSEYECFVKDFYNNSKVNDERVYSPSKINCFLWNNMLNIVTINTALISDGNEHKQIIDINLLSKCTINNKKPTILIGHHGIDSLFFSHAERLESFIDRRQVSAYLHGDIHKYANNPISKISVPNRTIPAIACGKSAPQSGDSYSDIGVIYYEWHSDENVYIQAFKWFPRKGFIEDPTYYYSINKKTSFPMLSEMNIGTDTHSDFVKYLEYLAHNQQEVFMEGKWIEKAELFWSQYKTEIIGRSLLLYYYDKGRLGDLYSYNKSKQFFCELEQIVPCEEKTKNMLNSIKF